MKNKIKTKEKSLKKQGLRKEKDENKKQNRFFLREQEFDFLKCMFEYYKKEFKIFTVAMLFSARSTRSFFRIQNEMRKADIKRSLEGLKKKNYLKIKNGEIHITKLGEKVFLENKLIRDVKNNKKKWDGKWRMLSFDIPTDMNTVRTGLRRILLKAGFLQIQKSVYIYPHEIKEFLLFLKEHKEYKKYIIYAEITRSTAEKEWLENFKDLIK